MALSNAIANIASKAAALANLKEAPALPPESINQFPFAATYARATYQDVRFENAGWAHVFHTIYCEIHVARTLLPRDANLAMSYIEPFIRSLLSDQYLGGTVDAVTGLRYSFGRLEWAGQETLGVRFEIDVKMTVT